MGFRKNTASAPRCRSASAREPRGVPRIFATTTICDALTPLGATLSKSPSLLQFLNVILGRDWEIVRRRITSEYIRLTDHPEQAPPVLAQRLLISGEDHRHRWHAGVDPIAICRVCWKRLIYGWREGGSTIEQQLVRTITGRYERTIRRKIREMVLATLVSCWFSKRVSPSVYLAIAYYGWHMNGLAQACERLGMAPRSIGINEAASLVARLKYPEPSTISLARAKQIGRRRDHLLSLYPTHINDGVYEHLNVEAVHDRPSAFAFADSVPRS